MAWRVLVPIKHSSTAKSRLLGATRDPADHAQLVHSIQLDTLDAVLAVITHPLVAGLTVLSNRLAIALPAQIATMPDPGGGLNGALGGAAAILNDRFPADGVVAMVGDLPALRPAELLAVLAAATRYDRSFVRDLAGTGTTLLAASPGQPLDPRFGVGSAAAHLASGAYELEAADSVRADVDSADDLRRTLRLGAGLLTSQMAALLS